MNPLQTLREDLDVAFPGSWDLDVGADQIAIMTIIHDSFQKMDRDERLARVTSMLESAGLCPGLLELLTPEEAFERGVTLPPTVVAKAPATWEDAISMVESGRVPKSSQDSLRKPRRIVFYSYKGGVGRTTALVHTAFHLARSGQRVAVVDMDVEAPGLHTLLPRPDGKPITVGLVDYLWERQVRPFDPSNGEGLETCLVNGSGGAAQHSISYAVEDPLSRAQIQVIPAGMVGPTYVRHLATLSFEDVLSRSDDAWTLFEKDLNEQLAPDILLIDARTGLGDWGGLSLLRLADEACIVLYPSDQNGEGVGFVRNMLDDLSGIKVHLVFSPIPEGPIGKELMARILPQLSLDRDEIPLEIYYTPGIASALSYPVEGAMAAYAKLVNRILETRAEEKVEAAIQKIDRWEIIRSLQFPQRDAKEFKAGDYEVYFQKTSDFDKFLDDARWVVRGRKGTGKSTLFHLFAEYKDNALMRARGKLDGITVLAGHGPAPSSVFRPTTDVFSHIQKVLAKDGHDWLSLWRAYAIIRIFTSLESDALLHSLKNLDLSPLRLHLEQNFSRQGQSHWRSKHTSALLAMVDSPLAGLCRDWMSDLNGELAMKGRKLWLLYDDLDQDIKENSEWQSEALGGLLRLAYDSNNQDLHNIRFKVFLREDIWNKLVFTNKSHFGDPRTLLLQWKIEDFLRLAYRLATGGSAAFRNLAQRDFPLTDPEVDLASEEQLRMALAPLWGLNQEKRKNAFAARWVYSRMTDAKGNTYPRSLSVLLAAARDEELRGREFKLAPKDRLLSPSAMQAGLKEASLERVNALKNEYPKLKPFLEEIEKAPDFRSQFKMEELNGLWEKTSQLGFPQLETFIAELDACGLLEKRNKEKYDFSIASLYIDGLGVKRVQGEKK